MLRKKRGGQRDTWNMKEEERPGVITELAKGPRDLGRRRIY